MRANYLLRRVGQAVLTFLIAVTLSFVLYHLMPGGPVQAMKSAILSNIGGTGTVDLDQLDRLVRLYTNVNPNEPIYLQYFDYLSQVILRAELRPVVLQAGGGDHADSRPAPVVGVREYLRTRDRIHS